MDNEVKYAVIEGIYGILAVIIGFILTKHWKEQIKKKEYINLIKIKLEQIKNTHDTWMNVKNYKSLKNNFVLISNELVDIISKAPANFSQDILNDLSNLYKSLNGLSTYSFGLGEDRIFEEKTQTILANAEKIKQKLKSIK